VETTLGTLRNGASQINSSFSSLSQAYASNAARSAATAKSFGASMTAEAKEREAANHEVALNGLKQQESLVKEQAQSGQISRAQELASLEALETRREGLERQHLETLRNTYQQGTQAYLDEQRKLDVLASQSALRRQEIERSANQQIYNDYKRSFEQIGSSVSSSIMGMIEGHETLRQAAQKVALSIIQSFIQAGVRMVADWGARIAANTTMTTAGQAAQTSAVATGTAARTALEQAGATASAASTVESVFKSISASAAETFAGIFGFLAPIMGPAAAGPAAAGEAAVMGAAGGLASFAVGAWSLPSDMVAQVHQGEMIVPAGPAAAMRSALAGGGLGGGDVHVHHSTNFQISAMDGQSVGKFLRGNGKQILKTINDGVRTGSHLGLNKLGKNS